MQRVKITKQGDPNEGREGLADVITSTNYPDQAAGIAVYFDGGPGFIIYGFNEIKTIGNVTVCQRSSNHKLKAIHNHLVPCLFTGKGVSKIVKSQIESNSQRMDAAPVSAGWCVKDRQITN